MGTLRMGDDPATSVTDAFCKFHDLDNLYSADGALFPTGSGYNPTLTIHRWRCGRRGRWWIRCGRRR